MLSLVVPPIKMIQGETDDVVSHSELISFLTRIWGVYNHKLYDLTDYVYTLGLNQNSATLAFLDSDFLSVFRQRSGQDITQPLNSVLNSMNSTYRQEHLACIENVFLAGQTDFRKTPRCQVQNYMLIVISGILMASIAMKCKIHSRICSLFS